MDGYVFAVNGKNSLVHLYDFGDTFVQQYMLNINNAFWKDVLESWLYFMKVYDKQENFRNNFYSIPVWYNSNIKIGYKSVFFKSWYEKGVKVVQDFFYVDGHFLCDVVFP